MERIIIEVTVLSLHAFYLYAHNKNLIWRQALNFQRLTRIYPPTKAHFTFECASIVANTQLLSLYPHESNFTVSVGLLHTPFSSASTIARMNAAKKNLITPRYNEIHWFDFSTISFLPYFIHMTVMSSPSNVHQSGTFTRNVEMIILLFASFIPLSTTLIRWFYWPLSVQSFSSSCFHRAINASNCKIEQNY